MLTTLEQKDLSRYAQLLAGLDMPAGTLHVSELTEPDGVKGFILYAYEAAQVVILALDDGGDLNYCDGLVRSVLFKAELRGLSRAEFRITDARTRQRIELLRFVKTDENTLEPISDIMDSCQSCKENPANT